MDCCENQLATGRVVCPKPRRLGPPNFNNSMAPFRFHMRYSDEALDSKLGAALLDLSLCKEGFEVEGCGTRSSPSPPFFFGSPPCRAQNPIVQDDHFSRGQKHESTVSSPSDSALVLPSAHNRVKFGNKQAAVRVEGFDCQSSRVVAMA